jgi:hypothetical protein
MHIVCLVGNSFTLFAEKDNLVFLYSYCSKKIPANPVNYNMCGHFFCKTCIRADENACPMCGVPSLALEITSDRLIANLIVGWKKICSIVGFEG